MIWLDAITEKLPGPLRLRVRGRSMLPTLRPGDEVVVQPVTAEALAPGDWVVVRGAQGAFLHRYLGWRAGRVVTKGDGHKALDPPWPPDAVLGRVVEAQRNGHCFYRRTPGRLRCERVLAAGHHVLGEVWTGLRRVKALLLSLFVVLMAASWVLAAVTLTSFTAEVGATSIILKWETASETQNLGFRLWRSLTQDNGYTDISGFIGTLDEGFGASYMVTDTDVIPGTTYYYKLQDLPANGSQNSFTDPISATIPLATTPTLTPTATATATPTPTPSASPTPNPNVRFWADKTDLTAGECTTLYWQTNNILAVLFDGAGVSGDGQRQFCPCATESHTLRVKYLNNTNEDFVITLNVTGQCGVATATATPTLMPRETIVDRATATPRSTSTPSPTRSAVDLTATASMPAATQSTPQDASQDNAAQEDAAQTPVPLVSALPTSTASSETLDDSTVTTSDLLPTRGLVESEPTGVAVEKLLSVWLLIVGGIVGAGFIGAGILMWKRQQ